MLLHGAFTFGSKDLAAPQAGLMAALSRGIVGGEMAWPLVIVGMLMGFAFILVQVRSPMLVAVGMYLPLETTFAIFVGGMMKGLVDKAMARRKFNAAQTARATNVGILLAAGLIAGEGLMGLVRAAWKFFFLQNVIHFDIPSIFKSGKYFGAVDLYIGGLAVLILIGLYLIKVPLKNAGAADEPPPPSAVI
jgi:uncharacterized oligopeptide transporter (OPT) family protein